MAPAPPWRVTPDGVELAVRLTPRGGLPGVEGVVEQDGRPYLRLRVAAAPVEGAANLALVHYLAKTLRLPRSAVTLVAGEHSRLKRLHLRGDDLEARLAALLPP
jgi:uncharacterized protein YggU (UPF0235/DUF167 family)